MTESFFEKWRTVSKLVVAASPTPQAAIDILNAMLITLDKAFVSGTEAPRGAASPFKSMLVLQGDEAPS